MKLFSFELNSNDVGEAGNRWSGIMLLWCGWVVGGVGCRGDSGGRGASHGVKIRCSTKCFKEAAVAGEAQGCSTKGFKERQQLG
jgi:hypothetical protein